MWQKEKIWLSAQCVLFSILVCLFLSCFRSLWHAGGDLLLHWVWNHAKPLSQSITKKKEKKKCVKSFFKSWVGACCPLLEMCACWDYAFIGSLVIIHKEDEDEPEMTGGDKPWRSIAQQQLADRWLSSSPHAQSTGNARGSGSRRLI